jgi:hypothetical protein
LADAVSTGSLFDLEDLEMRGFAVFSAVALTSALAGWTGSFAFLFIFFEALSDCMRSILAAPNKFVTICSGLKAAIWAYKWLRNV